jgi:hypothetical protein
MTTNYPNFAAASAKSAQSTKIATARDDRRFASPKQVCGVEASRSSVSSTRHFDKDSKQEKTERTEKTGEYGSVFSVTSLFLIWLRPAAAPC